MSKSNFTVKRLIIDGNAVWKRTRSDNTALTALTPSLDQCQTASHELKPHCVPVGLLRQYIKGGQDTAEELKGQPNQYIKYNGIQFIKVIINSRAGHLIFHPQWGQFRRVEMSSWKDAHFLAPCHKTLPHYLSPTPPALCSLHLPELMAHKKKLIIRFNLDYNVCSLDQQQQLWSICSESAAFGWPRVEHYSGGPTLYTPDGRRPSSLRSGEFGVWLKQLTLTPQPTHLFHPVATLEFHSFYPATF